MWEDFTRLYTTKGTGGIWVDAGTIWARVFRFTVTLPGCMPAMGRERAFPKSV